MKLSITLPEHIGDITLSQFKRYHKLTQTENITEHDFNKRKIEIFTDIKYTDVDNVNNKDYHEMVEQIDRALNEEVAFVDRFELNGIEFGFIPNFDKMTTKEYVDISLYPLDDIDNYNKLMAILFRPIIKKDKFNNYKIADYKGTEKYAKTMNQMPMNIVNGALVFFCNLAKDLQVSTQRSILEAVRKAQKQPTISLSGDGMQQ